MHLPGAITKTTFNTSSVCHSQRSYYTWEMKSHHLIIYEISVPTPWLLFSFHFISWRLQTLAKSVVNQRTLIPQKCIITWSHAWIPLTWCHIAGNPIWGWSSGKITFESTKWIPIFRLWNDREHLICKPTLVISSLEWQQ